jgi:hypothetical protein
MKPTNLSNRNSTKSYKSDFKSDKSFNSFKSLNNDKLNRLTSFNYTSHSKSVIINAKIVESIFQVVKMRLALENIANLSYSFCKNLIEENINLIDIKHMEVNSINKFVDDIIELIKSKNNKTEYSINSNTTINLENEKYRPRAISEEKFYRRRTIELGKGLLLNNNRI